jgi:hypothetical protein
VPPALDPALEQRIRSLFRDTAIGGEPATGKAHATRPRAAGGGIKDKA